MLTNELRELCEVSLPLQYLTAEFSLGHNTVEMWRDDAIERAGKTGRSTALYKARQMHLQHLVLVFGERLATELLSEENFHVYHIVEVALLFYHEHRSELVNRSAHMKP